MSCSLQNFINACSVSDGSFLATNSTTTTSFYGDYGAPGLAAANYDEGELIAGYTFIAGPGSHIGDDGGDMDGAQPDNMARGAVGIAPPPVVSGFAPNASGGRSAFDGVFVGRLTVRSGATLSGGMLFNMAAGFGGPTSMHLTLGGPGVVARSQTGSSADRRTSGEDDMDASGGTRKWVVRGLVGVAGAAAALAAHGAVGHAAGEPWLFDTNHDGVYDTVRIDRWGDGVADVVATDANQNGVVETIEIDRDNDGWYELTAIDSYENGVIDWVGVDGNLDGQVSLYDPEDAIPSCGRFLAANGWQPRMTVAQKRRVLWAYNRSSPYVDAVLALAGRL